MATTSHERQRNLDIQAMKHDPDLSATASAQLYTISYAITRIFHRLTSALNSRSSVKSC